MERILDRWQNFLTEKKEKVYLSEDRAEIRFKNLLKKSGGRVSSEPSSRVQDVRTLRQWKIWKRKVMNYMSRRLKKKKERLELGEKEQQEIEEILKGDVEFFIDFFKGEEKRFSGVARNFSEERLGHAKSKELRKMLSGAEIEDIKKFRINLLKKMAELYNEQEGLKKKAKRDRDIETTRQHESFHIHMEEIKEEYGFDLYKTLLQVLIGKFGVSSKVKEKGAKALRSTFKRTPFYALRDFLTRKKAYMSIYRKHIYSFLEEVITWARDILVNEGEREKFKEYLKTWPYEENSVDPREMINQLKSSWKEAVKFAQNIGSGDEDLEEAISPWYDFDQDSDRGRDKLKYYDRDEPMYPDWESDSEIQDLAVMVKEMQDA